MVLRVNHDWAVVQALRETEEELRLPSSKVEILGQLPPVLFPGKLAVTPVVGFLPHQSNLSELSPNPAEIAGVFTVDLAHLQSPASVAWKTMSVPGVHGRTQKLPVYSIPAATAAKVQIMQDGRADGGPTIWGLTGVLVHQMMKLLSEKNGN